MDDNNTGKIWERAVYGTGKEPLEEDSRSPGENECNE